MGRKQRRLDLHHLARESTRRRLTRAERRNLRWKLGQKYGLEWRSLGNIQGGVSHDALNDQIVANARTLGHVATHRP